MTRRHSTLRLGKGSAFVKSRLLRLPRGNVVLEADFCPLPEPVSGSHDLWLGLVVSHRDGSVLAQEILPAAPTVNDLATLLANSIGRPLTDEQPARPAVICIRNTPDWEELLPHLKQLEIQVVVTEDLPEWTKTGAALVHYLEMQQPQRRATDQPAFADDLLNLRLTAILFLARCPKRKDNP